MRYIIRYAKTILVSFFVIALISMPANAAESKPEQLSVTSAIEIAQKCNPQYTSLALQVDRAQVLRDDAADNVTVLPTGQLVVTPNGQAMVNSYEQTSISLTTAKKQLSNETIRMEKEVISAYTSALITANKIKDTKLTLSEMEEQQKLYHLARNSGLISNIDDSTYSAQVEQIKDTLAMYKSQYDANIATLRSLLNKGTDWNPVLTSQPIITKYSRQSLQTELLRATTASSLMTSVEAARDLERIKIFWPGFDGQDRYLDNIAANVKELDYEKTKRDTWSTVEQLYYGMDALEKQIVVSEKQLATKENDLKLAELKYKIGLISMRSLQAGTATLATEKLEVEQAKLNLDTLLCQMASNKANYNYLTGQTVFYRQDWKLVN